ncbi:hypothetical protein [Salaquimonas pukyongi]|uniref:hypothetical protein n=1 Tax=Salaquimonas pukyongi TaxID=2712698 RepID=UPI00096B697A|nr:hypothetical protein [Salaquimonas pukyongi]
MALAALAFSGVKANAQDTTINQNISGFNLPGVTLPQGHDEVRAADGTTCRTAVGGNGAYMDLGVIGNPERTTSGESSFSAYGRIVVPLGANRKRVDCTRLYDLEVARLEMELKLMQMGLNRGIAPIAEGSSSHAGSTPAASGEVAAPAGTDDIKVAQIKPAESKTAAGDDDGDDWADDGWTTEGLKKK